MLHDLKIPRCLQRGFFTPQLVADVLPLVAVATPLNLDHASMVEALAKLANTDAVKLKQLLGVLVEAGVLVRGGKLVRIIPDVLSDYILDEACFTRDGQPTGWATRVYEALAELDWRVRTASEETRRDGQLATESTLLKPVWNDIEDQFRDGSLLQRKRWLERLERLSFMFPQRLWRLVEIALESSPSEDPDEVSPGLRPFLKPTSQADVVAALCPILRGIACDARYTTRCANLLWEMGRDAETKPGHNPSAIATLTQLASYDLGKPFAYSHIILECCREWMHDPQVHFYRHSVLEVLTPMLVRQGQWSEMRGKWLSHGTFALPPEPLQELRHGALQLVEQCALSGLEPVVVQAIQSLHVPLSEDGLWEIREEQPEESAKWEAEQMAALDIVTKPAQTNSNPFVRLKIWEAVYGLAKHSPRPTVKKRAREILESLPHSFESRLILALTSRHGWDRYRQTWPDVGDTEDDWLEAEEPKRRAIDNMRATWDADFARQVAREWMARYPEPRAGFEALNKESPLQATGYFQVV